ncbi:hypothetical protein ACFO4N_17040 [Camelliibacillus cellulosilyticus]|uniref:Uncharacterized protein n=1 Tax=Camelliibacillus cellulosilyticus TaxID=2174486 RepID=A0ABV9GQ60_9BACL
MHPPCAMFGTYASSKMAVHAMTLAYAFAIDSTGIKGQRYV